MSETKAPLIKDTRQAFLKRCTERQKSCPHSTHRLIERCVQCVIAQATEDLDAQRAARARERRTCADWQPIETAPKDGTSVLVMGPFGADVARWINEGPTAKVPSGWRYRRSHSKVCDSRYQPAVWMPLPDPPRALAPSPGGEK